MGARAMIQVPIMLLPVLYALWFFSPFVIGFLMVRKAVRGR